MTPIVCLIAAYPCGKFLAWLLPIASWTPPSWTGYDGELSFNPGPFNIKEHTVILLMSNVAISPVYALHFSVACEKFYDIPFGAGFDILAAITSQTIGFAVAGLCRRFLVWPASLLWPQNLALSTLLNTLHAEEDNEPGAGISRHQFFCWAFVGAFAWNFLPGELVTIALRRARLTVFLFQATSSKRCRHSLGFAGSRRVGKELHTNLHPTNPPLAQATPSSTSSSASRAGSA
jgi:hypothetical protein